MEVRGIREINRRGRRN